MLFFQIYITHCTYCQFVWPPAAAVRWRHSALCCHIQNNYDTPVAKLKLCLSTLNIWFCYNELALNPDQRQSCLALPSADVLVQLPLLSMSPEPLSRFPIRSGFLALPLTVDSHLIYTSLHFQNPVSIRSVHSTISVRTSHSCSWTSCSKKIACSLVDCRLDYANSTLVEISIKNISRLQRLQSTLACVVTCQRGRISMSKTLQELHWLHINWRIDYKVATLTYKLLESGEPTYLRSRITSKIFRRALRSSADDRQMIGNSNHVHPIRKLDHVPFIMSHRQYGTAYHMTLKLHHLSLNFRSRRTISSLPFNILLWF